MKLHILQILAYLVIITAGIKAAASIISIILLAALFAVSLMPIVIWLMQKGLSKSATLSIIIVFIIIATLLMGSVLSVAFIGMAEKAPQYEEKFMLLISEVYQLMGKFGIDLTKTFSLQGMEGQKMMAFATAFFESIVSVFSDFTIVFLLIIFLIIDLTDLRFRIQRGERSTSKGLMNLYDLAVDIRKYVSISAFTGFLTALGNFILLIIIGVDFPFLWAFLSFLFSFIPNIGFILSVIPPALLACLRGSSPQAPLHRR